VGPSARKAAQPAASQQTVRSRLRRRTEDAFAEEERLGLMLAARIRTIAIAVVLFWQAVDNPSTGLTYLAVLSDIIAFGVLGLLQYACAKWRFHMHVLKYVFVLADCALLAFVFSYPDPFGGVNLPPALVMDGSRFSLFFVFLMQAAFSFRPLLVLWCGLCIVVARTGMLLWLLNQPGVFTNLDLPEQTAEAFLGAFPNENFIFLGHWATEVIACLIVAAGLAVVVRRSRRLVASRATAERTRASLARYFSPNVVDHLSRSSESLGDVRQQNVAVLFVDIVGFTALCEKETPANVIALLRDYHNRLGKAVFDNGGTLDKYIGDALMATFGTPDPGPQDAFDALSCAMEMIAALDRWNDQRRVAGAPPVRIGIGLHYGPVIAGDIGNERRLEYSVVGDTVNTASRLERLTRSHGTPLVASDALVAAIGDDGEAERALLEKLVPAGVQQLRGKDTAVAIWVLKTAGAAVPG